jgi:hypothetical protein
MKRVLFALATTTALLTAPAASALAETIVVDQTQTITQISGDPGALGDVWGLLGGLGGLFAGLPLL